MPLFARPSEPVPDDPLEWRPQAPLPRRTTPNIADPILEPEWQGIHVLAHFQTAPGDEAGPVLRLIDDVGVDASEIEPEVVEELARAVDAADAVIDGFLTDQATRSGIGATAAQTVHRSSAVELVLRPGSSELEVPSIRGHDREHLVAFVAVDLLRIDGETLFDVPLLERKRLLDGLIRPTELVRVSPYTRPPLNQWLSTWSSAGFAGALVKAANSRYRPSALAPDWTVVRPRR